jgi:hypothetical protein
MTWGWYVWLFMGVILTLAFVYVYMQATGKGFSRTVNGRVVWGRRTVPDRHGVPIPDPVTPQNVDTPMGMDVFRVKVDREKIERIVNRFCHSVTGLIVLRGEIRNRLEYCKVEATKKGSAQPLMEYFEVLKVIAEVLEAQGVDFGPEYQIILKDISDTANGLWNVPVRNSKSKKQPPTQWDRLLDNDL